MATIKQLARTPQRYDRDRHVEENAAHTALPSANKPVLNVRRREIYRPRQEIERTEGPVLGNVAQFGTPLMTVRQQIQRQGGVKQTDMFDASGKVNESFSTGQEMPDRQTKLEGVMGRVSAETHRTRLMPHIVRKNEIEGYKLGHDHVFPLGNMPFAVDRAGEQPHKKKLIEMPGHDQVTGGIYHAPQPQYEAEMRLFKDRAMDGRRPTIHLDNKETEMAPRVEQNVSRYRKTEFMEPRAPILHAEQVHPDYGRQDLLNHNRDLDRNKKWKDLQSKLNAGTPMGFSGYDMSPSSVEHRFNAKPTRSIVYDYQPSKTQVSYGRMPAGEVNVSREGQKFVPEFREPLFKAHQDDPVLKRLSRGVEPGSNVPEVGQ